MKEMNKKGIADFFVFIAVGLLMIFIMLTMSALVNLNARDTEVPESYREFYTRDLVRFLRTPANIISEDYNGLNFAEYIHVAFEENSFSEKFEDYAEIFLRNICASFHENVNNCQFEITSRSCISGTSTTHMTQGIETTTVPASQSCTKTIPSNLRSNTQVTMLDFQGPDGKNYQIFLRVNKP